MDKDEDSDRSKTLPQKGKPATKDEEREPSWAPGLRRIYDSVVEEELPDSFKDLLAKLDNAD